MTVETDYWYFDRFGPPDAVMRRGRERLPSPRPGQAVVALRAVGLNQADHRYLLGTHFPPDRLPSCVAHEAVGEIVDLGPGPEGRWSVGDRVALLPMLVDRREMGALRGIGVYDTTALLPVPPDFSDDEGAAFWVALLTAAGALHTAGLGPETSAGACVLVTAAAGSAGTTALMLARAWGAATVATTRRQEKVGRLAELATQVAVAERPEDLARAVRTECGDLHLDAVLDPVGGPAVAAGLEVLGRGGRFVSYEAVAGHTASYDVMELIESGQSVHGWTVFRLLDDPALLDALVDTGLRWAEHARPLVADRYAFADAPRALVALGRSEHLGKIVVGV